MCWEVCVRTVTKDEELDEAAYERLRDSLFIAARRLSETQLLDLADGLHLTLRRRHPRDWEEARRGTSGFA
jgi:hypothetical protein